jgi:hypothetical protein
MSDFGSRQGGRRRNRGGQGDYFSDFGERVRRDDSGGIRIRSGLASIENCTCIWRKHGSQLGVFNPVFFVPRLR